MAITDSGLSPKNLSLLLAACIPARRSVLIKGAPGIGKSDVVMQACNTANADLVIMHPVVSDPTDFKGLPGIVKNEAEFLPYGELRKLMTATKLTVCFLDDLGQAPPAVQAACMQLLLAREINGQKISDHVTFVAATNRREDRASVSGMLEPVKSRFSTIVELVVDVDDWIQWALAEKLPIELIAFVKYRPQLLHAFKPSADIVNSPCPRTVANLGALLQLQLPNAVEFVAFKGAVGEEFAAEFIGFLRIFRKLPNPDTVLLNPDAIDIPTDPAVLYALCGALSRKASENNFERLTRFAARLPAEFNVLLVRDAIKECPATQTTAAFIQWASTHADVMV